MPEKPAMRKPGGRLPCGGGGHGRKHLSGAGLRCSGAAGIGGRELPGGISPRGVRGREKRMVMPGKGLPPWGAVTGARRNFGAERIFRKGEGAFACAEPFADRGGKRVAVREGLEKGKNAPGLPCAAGRGAGLRMCDGKRKHGRICRTLLTLRFTVFSFSAAMFFHPFCRFRINGFFTSTSTRAA